MYILFSYHSSTYLILREIINQFDSILGEKIYTYIPHSRTCTIRAQRQFRTSSTSTLYRSSRHSTNIPRTREHGFKHPGSLVSDKCNARLKTYSLAFLIHPPSPPSPYFARISDPFSRVQSRPDSSGASFANRGPTARSAGTTCYTRSRTKARWPNTTCHCITRNPRWIRWNELESNCYCKVFQFS